jgi:hypothetical protein
MAMGVDVSRVYLMKVKLRQATEAACQAYANSLDVHAFIFENKMEFTEGRKNAGEVFSDALGASASFVPVETHQTGTGPVISGHEVEIVVIQCYGSAVIDAVVPFFGNYTVTASSAAKTKFSTSQ